MGCNTNHLEGIHMNSKTNSATLALGLLVAGVSLSVSAAAVSGHEPSTTLTAANGWYPIKARGGHRQFKHATRPGRVTVSGKPSHDLPPGTLNSILKQAGLQP